MICLRKEETPVSKVNELQSGNVEGAEEMKKKIKEALICLIAGGFVGVLMLYWMLGPLIQF